MKYSATAPTPPTPHTSRKISPGSQPVRRPRPIENHQPPPLPAGPLCLFQLPAVLWFLLVISQVTALSDVYVVKKNDTLSEIATKHNLPVNSLMQRNHLKAADKIFEGQKINIPEHRPSLDPAILRTLDATRVQPHKWKYIVIHHSASESGNAKVFDRYHREERHMENGLAYHFVIGNGNGMPDGAIAIGNRWLEQLDGGHLASPLLNEKSIGICLVGNFEEEHPTKKQMESLHALIDFLLNACHLKPSAVTTHQRINAIFTRCPGRFFPSHAFLKDLKETRENPAEAKADYSQVEK